MSLVSIASKINSEIIYLNELIQSLQVRYNNRVLRLKERFEEDVKAETANFEAIKEELKGTIKEFTALIEETPAVEKPKLVVNE
jgi:hypothetical protein